MSLQVWLPLNGNLQNNGICNTTITNDGATIDNNGKIGKCYSFNNTHLILDSTELQNIFSSTNQPFSMACWIYLNSDETDRVIIFGNYSASPFVNWELTASCVQRLCVGGTSNYTTKNDSTTIPKITWTHIACTYDGNNTKFYVNGILKSTSTGANTLTTKTSSSRFYIGSDARNDATRLKGKINDFRIYNHCLSEKEIEELAKGLILHYKLDNNGFGNPNLISNFDTSFLSYNNGSITIFSNQMSGGTQEIISNFNGALKCIHLHSSGGNNRQYQTISVASGKSYTVSLDYYSTTTQSPAFRGELNGGNYSWTGSSNANYTTPNKWQRLSFTYNSLTSNATLYYFIMCANGTDCYFKNIKVEEGTIATPWTPNTAGLGINNIIIDSSGLNNNGTIIGSPTFFTNTRRYNVITNFNGSNVAVTVPNLTPEAVTVTFWMKRNANTGTRQFMYTAWTGITCELTTDDRPTFAVNRTSYPTIYGNAITTDSGWVHYCGTFDTTNGMRLYQNGQLVASNSNTTAISYSITTNYIGMYSSNYFNGSISDFRLYATALTADQVRELYEASMSIDKSSNIYVRELIEN